MPGGVSLGVAPLEIGPCMMGAVLVVDRDALVAERDNREHGLSRLASGRFLAGVILVVCAIAARRSWSGDAGNGNRDGCERNK